MTIPDEAIQAAHAEYHKVLGDSNRSNPMLAALTAALPFLQGVKVGDAPLGAIENGRVFLQRLSDHYDFNCEAGSLVNCSDYQEAVRCFEFIAQWISGLSTLAPSPRAQALEEIRAIAEKQKAYWFEKQKGVKALEEAYSEDGEDYTPLGDHEAWKSGSANGHYSEADWFLKTIDSLLSHLAPIHADNAHGRPLEEEEFAIDKLRFRAFHTNSDADRQTYFDAVSKWLQDRHYRRMDADRALSSQPVADGWLPIETAPKDGTQILIEVHPGIFDVVSWSDNAWREGGNFMQLRKAPTHWRPLPTSPGASE